MVAVEVLALALRSHCLWPWLRSGRKCSASSFNGSDNGKRYRTSWPDIRPKGKASYIRSAYSNSYATKAKASGALPLKRTSGLTGFYCFGSWPIRACTTSTGLAFRVEMWDREHIRWVIAASASVAVGHAALGCSDCELSGSTVHVAKWSTGHTAAFVRRGSTE